jgi:hypothetical protein
LSLLSDSARHEHYITLSNSLPPPVLDEPEYSARRLVTAVETFNALRPGDAYEARLAVRIVLCGAHADECLRLAGVHREDFAKTTRCRTQAASMMRAELATMRALEREQKMRLAVEAVAGSVSMQSAATDTAPGQPEVTAVPPQQAEPQAPPQDLVSVVAPPSVPEPHAATSPRLAAANPAPLPVQAAAALPPSPEAIAKAEAFAQREIVAAAQIRHDRGVTAQSKVYFRHMALPTDPALIDALVRGSSDALSILDEVGGEILDEAA